MQRQNHEDILPLLSSYNYVKLLMHADTHIESFLHSFRALH